ncbi:MAG: cell envelope protein, partial [Campylobacterota bacterium]|nr:cell envelope protein [Campylobacterota bacterium]
MKKIYILLVMSLLLITPSFAAKSELTPKEAQQIAKEAYTYVNPMVDNYRILHSHFVDSKHPEFKA